MTQAVAETNFSGLVHRGKVRDTYDIGGGRLLMIATDRISAFDVVLPTPIPGKGLILAQMSAFWFKLTSKVVKNHFIGMASDPAATSSVPRRGALAELPADMAPRAMVIKRAKRVDIECVVRAYLAGSAWAEYRKSGTVQGVRLPGGLREAEKLPELMFTPTTKAEAGHDQPLTWRETIDLVGEDTAVRLRELSFKLFGAAHEHASARGMIVADTKFEFGWLGGELILIDEVLTPDSSRFWAVEDYRPGVSPPAFDKQFVRDWLSASGWNKNPPAPSLPADVIAKTRRRYEQALERLTGQRLME
ncbi:MAG: phosphoribosylaminoimidazolesuccinocarboxamide synthase [Chloroflexi bacterium]|nr:phosphoribosylaminoimidazolesuccinocarboxamide synthase [Chloroflexota bacterium]